MAEPNNKRKAAAVALAAAIAMPAEGLRQWYYYCPAGILSVCYGTTTAVDKARKYSVEECKALLDADMLKAVNTVERCAPGLPEQVLASFSDAVYNIGPKVACDQRNSTAARLLAQGRYQEACDQLLRWDRAVVAGVSVPLAGLTKRRAQERALCLGLT